MFIPRNCMTSYRYKLYTTALPIRIMHYRHDGSDINLKYHAHEFMELVVVTGGQATHCVNIPGESPISYPIRRGSVFLINMGESHTYQFDKGQSLVIDNILFDQEVMNYFQFKTPEEMQFMDFIYLLPQLPPEIRFLSAPHLDELLMKRLDDLIRLLEAQEKEENSGNGTVRLLLLSLIVALISQQYAQNDAYHLMPAKSKANILRLISYLQQHFSENLSLDELARIAMCSRRSLTRLFREITGETVIHYIQRLRLAKVCNLLRGSRKSVTEIAQISGFDDISYLNRVFKSRMHMTPTQYRYCDEVSGDYTYDSPFNPYEEG